MATLGNQRGKTVGTSTGTPAWVNTSNAVDGLTVGVYPATYATWTSSVSGAQSTLDISGFNFSNILDGSTITGVNTSLRHYQNVFGNIATIGVALYDGATQIGTTVNSPRGNSPFTDVIPATGGLPTVAQIKSATFKVKLILTHAANTNQLIYYLDNIDMEIFGNAPAGASGRPKAYVAGSFQQKPGKWWNGSAWVEKPWKTWTGSTWKVLT